MSYKPFPIHVLPDPLRTYVVQSAAALGCDNAYIAVPLIPVTGSAIGNARRIRLKKSWTEPAVVWAATVGESGTIKSPGHDLATRPVWRLQIKLLRSYGEERAVYDAEFRAWKELPKKERGEPPAAPAACEHPICSDITVEALADRLLSTPRGTLISLDELAAWFGSFNQYKSAGADVSHWLAMHGARAMKVDRKTGDKTTIFVPHAAVSVTGTIQPATLQRTLLPEFFENGLAARLLVAMPPTRPKKWTEHEIDDDVTQAVDAVFENLYSFLPASGPDGHEPVMVDLTPAAKAVWVEFVDQHNKELQELTGHHRAAWAKLEGYAARLALIIHCVRIAAGSKQLDYIDEDDIHAGIELAQWFGQETDRVYRAMGETDVQRQRRELRQWIANRGGRVTVRDMQRNLRRYEHNPNQAERDLNCLGDDGLGAWQHVGSGKRGHPTQVFCLTESPDFPIRHIADADTNTESS